MMADAATNKAIVRRFFEVMSAGDVDTMLGFYADDMVLTTMGGTLISGSFTKADIAAAANRIYDVFPEGISFEILGLVAEKDRVAVEATSSGAHVSGAHYANHYHFLFHLRDGRITEMKEFMDTELVTDILCGGQRPAAQA
ncbi:nuclear transport factor 2 family protein [Sphingomonas jatrophae]|uniref:SnoaL-like domain-containing protein n=1 Tax=Sphingomonas jatrophae TaxID=1166337 RepID=A0A1I6KFS6_9SPHN|nr:nuclear transport factor 2 family protein [Sphingomonas jatrophae]SFR90063.1 hypothetical protein SAMN05192580_1690 [Sphingomonas jatrophae]